VIRPLTSLRFVFAFMVFCYHCHFYHDVQSFGFQLYTLAMGEGFIGVSFFFILSGFILSLNYADRFREAAISPRTFWILRFARIYPLYLLTLLLAIPFCLNDPLIGAKIAVSVPMLQSWIPDGHWAFALNKPAWSLSVEAFFYALFPIIVVPLMRMRGGAFILPVVLCVLIALAMTFTPQPWQRPLFYFNPLGRLGEFLLGIAFYRAYAAHKSRQLTYLRGTLLEAGAILLFCAFFLIHLKVPIVYRLSVYYWVPMTVLLYVFSRSAGAFSRLLSIPFLVLLGNASYAFYLLHYPIGAALERANTRMHLGQDGIGYFLLYFTITLICSIGTYLAFEMPVNRFLRQKLLPGHLSLGGARVSTPQGKK
jgi:peptidoglycan/LPS O-acetylase OafA/YrhL